MNRTSPIIVLFKVHWHCSLWIGIILILCDGNRTGLAEEPKAIDPVPLYFKPSVDDSHLLSFQKPPKNPHEQKLTSATPIFYAIKSLKWPNGLIPIYQTLDKKTKKWKITRRLTHGKENFTDPLFFALPPIPDSETGKLSGRWACEAIHRDGSIDFLHWEMGIDGETVFGRFDQDTDYRFAWLTGGHFKSPIIQIKAEYIDAKYELEGSLESTTFKGTWKQTENADGGTWTAEPAYPIQIPSTPWRVTNLYITIDPSNGSQSLSIDAPTSNEALLLCRIWQPMGSEQPSSD